MIKPVPVNEPLLDGNEKKYLMQCIETGWISSEGPYVAEFEEKFAASLGRKYGIAVCNGSAALEVAVKAIGIGPGDEVILPAFTIISCVAAIVRAGATPVLVDSNPETWNMDVNQLEDKITPNTKAIMPVHIYGLPVDMTPVVRLVEKYGLKMIEDAAEAHGLTCYAKPCGSFGNISTFSFYPNKLITTGEGGMIVTDDAYLANCCRSLRNLCFKPEKRFVHDELGYNFRMTNLQAAIGLAQLERLDDFMLRKRVMGKRYTDLLLDCADLKLPLPRTEYAENIYWIYGTVLEDNVPCAAKDVMRHLAEYKIGTRPFFWPMHEQPVFQRMGLFKDECYPVAERLARRGFYLPSGLTLDNEQIMYIVEKLSDVLNNL